MSLGPLKLHSTSWPRRVCGHITMQNEFSPSSKLLIVFQSQDCLRAQSIVWDSQQSLHCYLLKKKKRQFTHSQHTTVLNIQHRSKKEEQGHREEMVGQSKSKTQQGKLQILELHVWRLALLTTMNFSCSCFHVLPAALCDRYPGEGLYTHRVLEEWRTKTIDVVAKKTEGTDQGAA